MQWAKQKQAGFTIVELLIVVVVIAILAAITIVSYNGIQNRAAESAVQSDLRNAMSKFQAYKAINGTFPANSDSTTDGLGAADIRASKTLYASGTGNFLYCGNDASSRDAVGIIAVAKNGKTFAMATNRAFSQYTAVGIGDYQNACNDLVGTTSARYGYTGSEWRSWVNG